MLLFNLCSFIPSSSVCSVRPWSPCNVMYYCRSVWLTGTPVHFEGFDSSVGQCLPLYQCPTPPDRCWHYKPILTGLWMPISRGCLKFSHPTSHPPSPLPPLLPHTPRLCEGKVGNADILSSSCPCHVTLGSMQNSCREECLCPSRFQFPLTVQHCSRDLQVCASPRTCFCFCVCLSSRLFMLIPKDLAERILS